MPEFDVVIVGARCAGATLSTILSQRGLRVCMVDKASFPSEALSTCAFQSNGVEVLRRIGVYDELLSAGAHVVKRATITSTNEQFTVDIAPDVYGHTLGMRRTTLDAILVDFAARSGVDVRTGCAVNEVISEHGRVVGVATRSGPITASVVIGAVEYFTRRAGRLPSWAFYDGVDPGFGFFFGTIGAPGRGSNGYSSLPLDGGQFLVSVNVPFAHANHFLADRYSRFDEELRRFPALAAAVHGATRIGPIRVLQKWHSYFRTAEGPGWALVGDAGHFKDYSLGQGQSDAFRQAENLADRVINRIRNLQRETTCPPSLFAFRSTP